MKKVLALILALAMILAAASAFATDSKTGNDITKATVTAVTTADGTKKTEETGLYIEILPDDESTTALKEVFAGALAEGNVLKGFPEDVQEKLDSELTTINEIVKAALRGNAEGLTSATVNFVFATAYPKDEKVQLAIALAEDWTVLDGIGQEDGSVNAVLDAEQIAKFLDKEFNVVVVSK